jgi:hypothetical protein
MRILTVTGQVERVSEYPVALGTYNDIYIGKPDASWCFGISWNHIASREMGR